MEQVEVDSGTLNEAAIAAAKVIPAEFGSGGYGLDYWRAVAEAVIATVNCSGTSKSSA